MGFLETNDLATAPSFRARLTACVVKVGNQFLDDPGDCPKAQCDKRIALARVATQTPATVVEQIVWPVLADPVIADVGVGVTDAQLEARVVAVWDRVAGVTAGDADPDSFIPTADIDYEVTGLSVLFKAPEAEDATYQWDFGDGTGSLSRGTRRQYAAAGTYHVTLAVSNPYGTATSGATVTVGPA